MWQSDGWAQTQIRRLYPELDVCPEAEFRALAGAAISIHAARVREKTSIRTKRGGSDDSGLIACAPSPNPQWWMMLPILWRLLLCTP